MRRFNFSEHMSLDLMAEAFNLFNRLNYASINNTVGAFWPTTVDVTGNHNVGPSGPLGFTSAFDARRIQLGGKFRF